MFGIFESLNLLNTRREFRLILAYLYEQLGRIPLREQVKHFKESRDYIVKVKGENETMKLLKEAIFSLTFGSNDIINYFQSSIPFFGSNKVAPSDYLDHMISNLTIHLKVR